jgi:chromosome segregation ATPase
VNPLTREPSEKKREAIIKAADTLAASGVDSPTNGQVLEALGGGSIADISPVMREWRQKRKEATQTMFSMPDSIKTAAQHLAAQLWISIDSEARKKVDEAEKSALIRTEEIEEELNQSYEEIKGLEATLESIKNEKVTLQNQLETTSSELKELQNKFHLLEIEYEKSKTRLESTLESEKLLRQQVADLQKDLLSLAKSNASKGKTTKS